MNLLIRRCNMLPEHPLVYSHRVMVEHPGVILAGCESETTTFHTFQMAELSRLCDRSENLESLLPLVAQSKTNIRGSLTALVHFKVGYLLGTSFAAVLGTSTPTLPRVLCNSNHRRLFEQTTDQSRLFSNSSQICWMGLRSGFRIHYSQGSSGFHRR